MGKPSPTPPPDPTRVAQAQTASNRETAITDAQLNRVNQVTPYGAVTYSTTPGPNGVPIYTQTTTESENQRRLREGQEGLGIGLNQLASDQVTTLGDVLGQSFDPRQAAGASGFSSRAAAGGPLDLDASLGAYNAGQYDPTAQPGLDLSRYNQANLSGIDLSRFDPSQRQGLDLSQYNQASLDPLALQRYDPSAQLGDYSVDVEARARELASRGLDEQFSRGEESLRSRLANQGIEAGSDAFDAEMRAFQAGKGDAYARAELMARDSARADRGMMAGELAQGAGLAVQERADLLARLNQGMAARSAERQDELYGLSAGAGLAGQERADLLARLTQGAGLDSQMSADALQRLGMGFDQYTGARDQRAREIMSQRAQNLAEAESDYNRDYAASLAARQIPLQEISAIMSGAPIQTLNPGAVYTSRINPTDVIGAESLAYNVAAQNYAQQMGARNALLGSLANLGGSFLTANPFGWGR